jgi:site-specific recombinase XerD
MAAGCQHPHIAQLKEPEFVLPTFTAAQVTRLVNWKPKPKHFHQRRIHLLTLLLLDTGCRISEALALAGPRFGHGQYASHVEWQRTEAENHSVLIRFAKGSPSFHCRL